MRRVRRRKWLFRRTCGWFSSCIAVGLTSRCSRVRRAFLLSPTNDWRPFQALRCSSSLRSIRMICRARFSSISRCRGTDRETPVLGLRYQSCFAPVSKQHTAERLNRPDEIDAFHDTIRSSTRRAPGINPADRMASALQEVQQSLKRNLQAKKGGALKTNCSV